MTSNFHSLIIVSKPHSEPTDIPPLKPFPAATTTHTTYARSPTKSPYHHHHIKAPYGWLVDFINHFGQLNGFQLLLDRFTHTDHHKLNIQLIAALLKPWGLCYELLTAHTVRTYFLPIIELVPRFFENLTDEDIKKECKSESKNDSISTVIKWLKLLATRIHTQDDLCKNLEILRLKTILRILKFASFNGKMNALNEVNKVISNVTYHVQMRASSSISGSSSSSSAAAPSVLPLSSNAATTPASGEEEWLTSERMAKWIQENDVLDIVLRDCMHQPQYVEKLEKMLRFLIKEKALTLKDLDKIWESQVGKHEAIEKNVHDLLSHSEDAPTEIIDQAVAAHVKILDYSCSSDKEAQKLKCLEKCIEQLKENKWVIVSMRQIREILQQYPEVS